MPKSIDKDSKCIPIKFMFTFVVTIQRRNIGNNLFQFIIGLSVVNDRFLPCWHRSKMKVSQKNLMFLLIF